MPRRTANGEVLSRRQLNRTLLDRQMLLERQKLPALDAVEHLLGLQAQDPVPPYIALWNRLEGFDPSELSAHVAGRSAVRLTLMRGTVHLVLAADALTLRPLMQPVLDRLYKGGVWSRGVKPDDLPAIRDAGRQLLEEKPLTTKQLGESLQPRWPENDGRSMAYALHTLAPLVHVPPRGVWRGRGQTTVTTLESWLGRDLEASPSIEDLARRYLGAFGPASVRDMQSWSGLTRLREVFEVMRPRLGTYQDEDGRELFDLADAALADPGLPAPVRFNPAYDNLFISHADRSRLGPAAFQRMMVTANSFFATFMVDGFFRGRWELTHERKQPPVLNVMPFARPLAPSEWRDVEAEAQQLLALLAPEAADARIVLLPPQEA